MVSFCYNIDMSNVNVNTIKKDIWVKNWAGRWSLLTCFYLGQQYSQRIRDYLGVNLQHSIIVVKRGFSTCYFSKKELDKLGHELATKVAADKKLIPNWIKKIKNTTRDINEVMRSLSNRPLSFEEYSRFLDKFIDFGACNFAVKKVVDYLPSSLMSRYLNRLAKARLYSENVYADTEKFMEKLAARMGKQEGYQAELILCLSDREFEKSLKTGKIVIRKRELEQRFKISALFFDRGKDKLMVGKQALNLEAALVQKSNYQLSGLSAHPGCIKGVARIILNPFKKKVFNRGDILVASMTRPEYLSLIKLSSAFITDAGGRLCHAAITAREIKKPCIVGLELATKSIPDGSLIEVDADNGIVKILKRA